jgi:hypothetical protein
MAEPYENGGFRNVDLNGSWVHAAAHLRMVSQVRVVVCAP